LAAVLETWQLLFSPSSCFSSRACEACDSPVMTVAISSLQEREPGAAARDRPVSAPSNRGGDYEKYHDYLDRLAKGDK